MAKEMRGDCRDLRVARACGDCVHDSDTLAGLICDYTVDWELLHLPEDGLGYCSPSCERITGYPPQRFLDTPGLLADIILSEDRESWDRHRHGEATGIRNIVFRIRHADGTMRWIEHVCQPVRDGRGRFAGTRSSNRDISARMQAVEEVNEARRQLELRNVMLEEHEAALRATMRQLEVEKQRIRDDMVASIHDILLPLIDRLERHGTELDRGYLRLLRGAAQDLGNPLARVLAGPRLRLTAREIGICDMIRRGLSSKTIASILVTSVETVRTQRRSIRRKLGLNGTGQNLEAFLNGLSSSEFSALGPPREADPLP